MRWHVTSLAAAFALGLFACGEPREEPRAGFSHEPPARPAPTALLRADTMEAEGGRRWMDLDVLMPPGSDAVARATLQRVIDSIARADTLAVAVRATGFVIGPVDATTQTADLAPTLRAVWGPPDSAWAVGAGRRHYRTHFVVLRSDAPAGSAGRQ